MTMPSPAQQPNGATPQAMPMPMPQPMPRPSSLAGATPAALESMKTADPSQFGWSRPSTQVNPRMIIAISGLEKQGKTHMALTASLYPELCPVFIFDYDNGLEGVIEHFVQKGGDIWSVTFRMDPNWSKLPEDQKKVRAGALYEEFQQKWAMAIARGKGTIIIDTHTEEYEIRRLAKFGKLQQVMPQHYAEVNNEFRADIREAYDSGMNVIMLQKLKKEYVSNNFTGKYEPAGFADLPFNVQANLQAYRDPTDMQFKILIKDCRQNAALANTLLVGEQCDMGFFLNLVFEQFGHVIPSAQTRATLAAKYAAEAAAAAAPSTPNSALPPHLQGLA